LWNAGISSDVKLKGIPLLIVNHESTLPPYDQISLQLRMLIASAQVLPGTLLLPVRQLAEDLGVAPNTVIRAYDALERDGWVVRSARKSVAIVPHPPPVQEERQQRLTRAIAELLEIARLLNVSVEELYAAMNWQVGLTRSIDPGHAENSSL
jgi:GntR family transcriptional regulator